MGILDRLLGGGDESIARAHRPQALAASLGSPPAEGLDWLGRAPSPRVALLFRVLWAAGSSFLFGLCRIRLEVEGREHIPDGGHLVAAALHRSWIDPLVVIAAWPLEPRIWFLGSGPSAFDRPWKEWLLRRIGGFLPVWRGGAGIETHVRAARAVVASGGRLALFFEGAIGGEPDRVARIRAGSGLLALRTQAPIVPIAICGAEQLYRGKRIAARVLPATTVRELLGAEWDGSPPEPGTREELRLARRISERLGERIDAEVQAIYPGTIDPPGRPREWPWLTRLFR
jgi:1-acyl-sn-glycerol-3-phosphate acyltransferase